MDKQVQLAMVKWPNVPDCYGWLGLDARGCWRMRDQQVQDQGATGSKISNAALRGFINRNYLSDGQGRYFFQNGPQRVYVELQATPFIAHFDPVTRWTLHTGTVLTTVDNVWMTDEGILIFQSGAYLAQLDDRDMASALSHIYFNEQLASDEKILAWLTHPDESLTFLIDGHYVPVKLASLVELAASIPFVSSPMAQNKTAGSPAA